MTSAWRRTTRAPGRSANSRAGCSPPARGLLRAQPGEPPVRADWVVRPARAEPARRAGPRLLRVLEPRRADGGRDVVDLGGRESGEPREGDRVDPRRDGPPSDGALHPGRDPGREGQPSQFADRVARAERGGRLRIAPDGILRPRHGLPGALPRGDRRSDGGAGPGRRAEVLPALRELDGRGRAGGPHPAPPVTRNYIISELNKCHPIELVGRRALDLPVVRRRPQNTWSSVIRAGPPTSQGIVRIARSSIALRTSSARSGNVFT